MRFGGDKLWFEGVVKKVEEIDGNCYCHILYDKELDEDGKGEHQDYEEYVPYDRIFSSNQRCLVGRKVRSRVSTQHNTKYIIFFVRLDALF